MKKNKSLFYFVIGGILLALFFVLPESITSELGPIIPIAAVVLIVAGILSLNTLIVSKMSPRMFFISGLILIFIGVIALSYSLTIENISGSIYGVPLLLDSYSLPFAGSVLFVSFFIAGAAMLIKSGGEVVLQKVKRFFILLIAGPVIATVIALIFHFGLSILNNSSYFIEANPGATGKLWEWLIFGLKSGLHSSAAIVILGIIASVVGGFIGGGFGDFVAIPRLGGGFTIFEHVGGGGGGNYGCLIVFAISAMLFSVFYGLSFWLGYRFDLSTDKWITPITLLTIFIWGFGFFVQSSEKR